LGFLEQAFSQPHTRHDCVQKRFILTPLKVIIFVFLWGWVLKSQTVFELSNILNEAVPRESTTF